MSRPQQPDELTYAIRAIYGADPAAAEERIEKLLEQKFRDVAPPERVALLEDLLRRFPPGASPVPGTERPEVRRLLSLVLGDRVLAEDLASPELFDRLAHSLNTVFDSLNRTIGIINTALLGRTVELETIRFIIGSSIEDAGRAESLQGYLDRIQEAFLVAHKAFRQAAESLAGRILAELSPETIATGADLGMKFGPLRKAELYDLYAEKHRTLTAWSESGRMTETFLREFERTCQKLIERRQGETHETR
jgi:hypothetical protein